MASLSRAARRSVVILVLWLIAFALFARAVEDDQDEQYENAGEQDSELVDDDGIHRPATPPGPEPDHARPQIREHLVDADDGLHQQQSWMITDYAAFPLYPDVARFYVRRWTSPTTSWISPNCPASSLPSPPSRHGPSACACPGPSGQSESVYGQMEIEHLWTWCADWRDLQGRSVGFQRLFIPDIWNGQGPCPRFEQTDVLHRMPARIIQAGGWFRIDPTPRAAMEAQEDLDNALIPTIFRASEVARLPDLDRTVFQGAPTKAALTEYWASWVQSLLARRGYIVMELIWNLAHSWLSLGRPDLWTRIREMRYFGAAPLGAWFDRTFESAGTIRRLIRLGIPVYYRWEESEHGGHPELADLRPRPPPQDESQGVVMPPLSPHRAGRSDKFWHRYSSRSTKQSAYATTLDGRPIHVSREEMAHLTDQDPNARPPPLRFGDLARDSRSRDPQPAAGPSRRRRSVRRAGSQASSNSRAEGESSSQASRSLRGSLASRISSPPPNTEEPIEPIPVATHGDDYADASWEFIFGETHERGRAMFETAARNGELPHHSDRVAFAVDHRMAFHTGRERTLPEEDLMDTDGALDMLMADEVERHYVPPTLAVAESLPVADRFTAWEAGVRAILARPHGRAALARGGLVARIAQEFGMTVESALSGPSESAQDIPNDQVIDAPGGRALVDDYLTEAELSVILGHVGIRGDSLWPDETVFRSNGWDGVWSDWHEAWFIDALTLMRQPGLCATSKRDQWRSAMRKLRHRGGR